MSVTNSIRLVGNIANTPELRYTQTGNPALNFRLAVDERYAEGKKNTEFFSCVLWGPRAEGLAKILRKGMQLTLAGSGRHTRWKDQTGTERFSFEVRVEDLVLPTRSNGSSPSSGALPEMEGVEDEVPFG